MDSAAIQDAILIALRYLSFKDILSVSQVSYIVRLSSPVM